MNVDSILLQHNKNLGRGQAKMDESECVAAGGNSSVEENYKIYYKEIKCRKHFMCLQGGFLSRKPEASCSLAVD